MVFPGAYFTTSSLADGPPRFLSVPRTPQQHPAQLSWVYYQIKLAQYAYCGLIVLHISSVHGLRLHAKACIYTMLLISGLYVIVACQIVIPTSYRRALC